MARSKRFIRGAQTVLFRMFLFGRATRVLRKYASFVYAGGADLRGKQKQMENFS